MREVPLSNEETRVIFTGQSLSGLADLEGSKQKAVIHCLISIIESASKPRSRAHEQIANLDIFTAGSTIRLYTKVVEDVPRGNEKYHLIYLFYIDHKHEYARSDLVEYSERAQANMEIATSFETVCDVEEYFEEQNAYDADGLRAFLQ